MQLLRYRAQALTALAVKALPLAYGAAVILGVNTHLPRNTELGVYSLALATFFTISLAGKCFALYPLIKFLAEGERSSGTWRAGVIYWIGIQTAAAVAIWSLAPLAPSIFHAPGLDQGWRWAAGIILVFIPRDLASALLQARRQIGRLFILEGCYFLFAAGGIVYLASQGELATADQVLGLNLAGGLLSTLAAPLLCWKRAPKWRSTGQTEWSRIAVYGRDSLGIGVGEMAYTQLDYHLLGFYVGASEVALYFAAKNFFRFYNAITQAINLLIFPASSNLFARGEISKLKELIEKVLGGYLGLLLFVNILVLIGADWIVAIVYRGLFPDAANLLRIFALASFFEPIYNISENVLYGIGKPRAILVTMWVSLALFILCSAILMPLLGAIGGALTILLMLFSLGGIIMIYMRKELGVTPLSILKRCWGIGKGMLSRV